MNVRSKIYAAYESVPDARPGGAGLEHALVG